jgi:antitoxin MazE
MLWDRSALSSCVPDQARESLVHVVLVVAVEQRRPGIVCDEVARSSDGVNDSLLRVRHEGFDRRAWRTHDAPMDDKAYLAKIERWDGGLAIRLPHMLVERLGLKVGDDVKLMGVRGSDLTPCLNADRQNILNRLRVFRGRMPSDFPFDQNEANAR